MAEPIQQARLAQASNRARISVRLGSGRESTSSTRRRASISVIGTSCRQQAPQPARQEIRLPPDSSASATPFSTASDSMWRIGRIEPGGTGARGTVRVNWTWVPARFISTCAVTTSGSAGCALSDMRDLPPDQGI